MATLKFYIRTAQKGFNSVSIRARFQLGRGKDFYGTTNFITPVKCWDDKKGTIKQSARFDDDFTIEMAQQVIEGLFNLEQFIIAKFKKVDKTSMPKEWLQDMIKLFHDEDSKVDHKKTDIVLKPLQNIEDKSSFPVRYDITRRISTKKEESIDIVKMLEEEKEDKTTLNGYLSNYIAEAKCGKRLTLARGERFAKSTIKTLKGFQSQFYTYQIRRNKLIRYEDITLEFYKDYTQFFTIEKGYSLNTVGRMVQNLITIMLAANDDCLHNNLIVLNRKFKVIKTPVDNVYLTDERLDILYDISKALFSSKREELLKWNLEGIVEATREAWSKAIDVFLVGCWSGQRYSDYSQINKNMIVTIEGKKYIKLLQVKTKKIVYIPLIPQIEEILNRYNGYLPITYEQKVNTYIKLICKCANFKEVITIIEKKAGETKLVSRPFYELVKTHTARRSFATNMRKSGASLSSIADITGHSDEQTLRRYLKLDAIEKAQLAAECDYFKFM